MIIIATSEDDLWTLILEKIHQKWIGSTLTGAHRCKSLCSQCTEIQKDVVCTVHILVSEFYRYLEVG